MAVSTLLPLGVEVCAVTYQLLMCTRYFTFSGRLTMTLHWTLLVTMRMVMRRRRRRLFPCVLSHLLPQAAKRFLPVHHHPLPGKKSPSTTPTVNSLPCLSQHDNSNWLSICLSICSTSATDISLMYTCTVCYHVWCLDVAARGSRQKHSEFWRLWLVVSVCVYSVHQIVFILSIVWCSSYCK